MSYIPKKTVKHPVNVPLITAIDAFMQTDKYPIGVDFPPSWEEGRELGIGELTVKFPLEINGEIGDQKLIINASPNSANLKFNILITFEPTICRLDFDETVIHMNSHAIGTDDIDSIVRGSHYHSWELNKRFFTHSSRPIDLHNAISLESNIRRFDSALRWFCTTNRVILRRDHCIEFPERSLLL